MGCCTNGSFSEIEIDHHLNEMISHLQKQYDQFTDECNELQAAMKEKSEHVDATEIYHSAVSLLKKTRTVEAIQILESSLVQFKNEFHRHTDHARQAASNILYKINLFAKNSNTYIELFKFLGYTLHVELVDIKLLNTKAPIRRGSIKRKCTEAHPELDKLLFEINEIKG
ncbi:Hypothetical_protein [Hexamita inflata]|uniref:Hypothetical_protein n=1 Tax=Hexamita inflata TaxID=28002 RepID=A0AA86U628_9EUKA|nr:Hypothetical protein HINF_LOCUS19293 [Hexamita inflata]